MLVTMVLAMMAAGEAFPVPAKADLVFRGGTIVTLDAARPQAEALAVAGDRVLAVGSNSEISRYLGDRTRIIELEGRLLVPGFIESHGHFLSLGESRMVLDLSEARSWEECVERVARVVSTTPPGRWIVGRGWHQGKWDRAPQPNVEGYPTHELLTGCAPFNPVLLTHGTGHMVMVNEKALQAAGLRADKRFEGGEALRDAQGRLTGALRENAADPVQAAYSRSLRQRTAVEARQAEVQAVRLAMQECLANGVTTFQDAGSSFHTVDLLRELAERGELQVRLWVMLNEDNEALARRLKDYRIVGAARHHLTVRAIKRLIDGALGTQGAWLLEPYDDLPSSSGLNTTPLEAIRRTAELALAHDFQLCVHAIGDRANRAVLDLYEDLVRQRQRADLRWRIEHAQHLHPDDIPRFARLGVIAAMQGVHCTSDGPFVVQRLGQQRARQGAYAWRSLLDAGARIANGTDVPVERISPIACFYSSVTRRMAGGQPFFPEQSMTRLEALKSYTFDAAYAAFEENLKGQLAPGKLADLVVLSKNILTVEPEEIPTARVLYTVVGGQVRYEAKER